MCYLEEITSEIADETFADDVLADIILGVDAEFDRYIFIDMKLSSGILPRVTKNF